MATESVPQELANVVELDWFADNDTVTVTPRNQQRFDIQKDRAIEVLQAAKNESRFRKQLDFLVSNLALWINRHLDGVGAAYLTMQDGAFSFVVVRNKSECDDAIQDSLSDLDFQIANDADLDLIQLDAIALPPVSDVALTSFLDRRFAVKLVHGNRVRPHSPRQ